MSKFDELKSEDNLRQKSSSNIDKKLKLLIAEEELRKRKDRERILRLEQAKNDSFQKKLQKIKSELEYKEFQKKLQERELELLQMENEALTAEEKVLEEIKVNAYEVINSSTSIDENNGFSTTKEIDDEMLELERQKRELRENLRIKKQKIEQKNDEVTRLIDISKLK